MSKYDKETKFYWLQLKEDFFEDDAIEWLEEQKPNGKEYAYFYLKLCLKSLKSNGILIRKVGNILIPYNNQKLAELTKTDFDTVTIAMELLKKIDLVKILENGEIYITQLENLIGSISKGALIKQQQRALKKEIENKEQTDSRQKSTKDKDKDRYINIKEIDNNKLLSTKKVFVKPTLEEVKQYCLERKNNIDAETFIDFYESKGWYVGKNKMKDWKATIRTWERNRKNQNNFNPATDYDISRIDESKFIHKVGD